MKKILTIIICLMLFFAIAYGEQSKTIKSRTLLKGSNNSISKISPIKKDAVVLTNSEVQIYDLTVLPPGSNQNITCTFKVRNNTNQNAASGKYKYFVNRRNPGGAWELAFSSFLPAIGAKQVISCSTHAELSLLDNEVQIAIHEDNNSTKPIITQATGNSQMPSVSSVQIESVLTEVNYWEVVVRNNSQYYLWNISVQSSVESGGVWTGAGGTTIVSIAPGESGKAVMPKPMGWKTGYNQFKISLRQVSDLIAEQTYPL